MPSASRWREAACSRRWCRRSGVRLDLREGVGDDGVRVTVPESVLGLEPRDELAVLHRAGGVPLADEADPVLDRLAVVLLDRREVRRRSLGGRTPGGG